MRDYYPNRCISFFVFDHLFTHNTLFVSLFLKTRYLRVYLSLVTVRIS